MGSEMCIRDRLPPAEFRLRRLEGGGQIGLGRDNHKAVPGDRCGVCLLYTSDAADERSSVDLGGRRIIKKKNKRHTCGAP